MKIRILIIIGLLWGGGKIHQLCLAHRFKLEVGELMLSNVMSQKSFYKKLIGLLSSQHGLPRQCLKSEGDVFGMITSKTNPNL